MPTYEYQCFACGHRFEEFQKISDDPIKVCPECHKEEVKRLVSASAFHLKGSGWYKTDYSSSKSGSSPSPRADSPSTSSSGSTESSSSSSSGASDSGKSQSSSAASSASSAATAKPAGKE